MISRAFLAAVLLSLAAGAQAGTILDVQFAGSGYTGAAVVGSPGDYWNSEGARGTGQVLLDPSDEPTDMTLTWSTSRTWAGYNGFASTSYAALMAGYLFNGSADPVTITLAGLTPNAGFDLYIYSEGDTGSDLRTMHVNANGVTADTTETDYTANSFILGQNYLELAVVADGNGQLAIAFNPTSQENFEADLNAFQLTSAGSVSGVPEPSMLGLLAAGLAGMVWRKCRAVA